MQRTAQQTRSSLTLGIDVPVTLLVQADEVIE
jgi:hypothetical protein